ncbi:hypothetical protein PINS_up003396 [Pythium insidiosum]|nr:hypothetical protein PINS_up003396 [Pythium insidiosum]
MAELSTSSEEDARRRLKNREHVRRHYEAKRRMMEELRSQLRELETQYDALVRPRQDSEALRKYREISRLKHRLAEENKELRQLQAERAKQSERLQQIVDIYVEPPLEEIPYSFQPLSEIEYTRIILQARDEAVRFLKLRERVRSNAQFCGWHDDREVHGERMCFAVHKRFHDTTAHRVAQRAWASLAHPKMLARFLSASLNSKFYLLQEINADTRLLYWTMAPVGMRQIAKTIFLLARVQTDDGYMVIMRGIEKDCIHFRESGVNEALDDLKNRPSTSQDEELPEVWDMVNVWTFARDDAAASTCQVHFGGSAVTSLWLVEVLLVAVRWEQIVFGRPMLQWSHSSSS